MQLESIVWDDMLYSVGESHFGEGVSFLVGDRTLEIRPSYKIHLRFPFLSVAQGVNQSS
jgi:hypothetical protein